MTPHTALRNLIRLELSKGPTRLFANERGVAKYGEARVPYGLIDGASDLVGWHRGLFVAIEVKTGNARPTADQTRFILAVQRAGGIAGVARSVEDARQIIERGPIVTGG